MESKELRRFLEWFVPLCRGPNVATPEAQKRRGILIDETCHVLSGWQDVGRVEIACNGEVMRIDWTLGFSTVSIGVDDKKILLYICVEPGGEVVEWDYPPGQFRTSLAYEQVKWFEETHTQLFEKEVRERNERAKRPH